METLSAEMMIWKQLIAIYDTRETGSRVALTGLGGIVQALYNPLVPRWYQTQVLHQIPDRP